MTTPRVLLIAIVLNLLIVAGGVAATYLLLKPNDEGQPAGPGLLAGLLGGKVDQTTEYQFVPVNKVILSLPGQNREHYFVLDLVLQAAATVESKKLEQIDPMVRNSVVAHLSGRSFEELRGMPIAQLQEELEKAVRGDITSRNIAAPEFQVLISKLVVQ